MSRSWISASSSPIPKARSMPLVDAPREVQSKDVAAHTLTEFFEPATETLGRSQLRNRQLWRVQELFDEILPANAFYTAKFGPRRAVASWDDFQQLPLTTK